MADCSNKEYCSMLECVIEKAGKDAFADNNVYQTLLSLQQQIDALATNQGVTVEVEGKTYTLNPAIFSTGFSNTEAIYVSTVVVPQKGLLKKIGQNLLLGGGSITLSILSSVTGNGQHTFQLARNQKMIEVNLAVEAGDLLRIGTLEVYTKSIAERAKSAGATATEVYMLEGLDNLFAQTGTQPQLKQNLPAPIDTEDTGDSSLKPNINLGLTYYIQEDDEVVVVAGKS